MIDFEKQFGQPDYSAQARQTFTLAATYKIVYGWMCAGLAISGVIAWLVASQPRICEALFAGPGFMICVVAELALVFLLSLAIQKIPVALAYLLFALYAAVNGVTLSVVFLVYEIGAVQTAFFVTAGMFGGLAVWGTVTKSDLSSIGSVCGLALWGVILASVVNIFMKSSGLDWAISFVAILVFTGLTMYDAQKIRQLAAAEGALDSAAVHRVGILGALTLYLDFVNLFLQILRFFGNGKRRD